MDVDLTLGRATRIGAHRRDTRSAEATPCLACGSELTIAFVTGVIASAAPAPMRTRPSSNWISPLPVSIDAITAKPAAVTREAGGAEERLTVLFGERRRNGGQRHHHDRGGQQCNRRHEGAVSEHELQVLQHNEVRRF